MQVALTFEDSKQRTSVPKHVVGLAAALLAGTAITPMNMQAVEGMNRLDERTSVSIGSSSKPSQNSGMNEKADNYTYISLSNLKVIEAEKEMELIRDSIISSVLSWEGIQYKWGGRTKGGVDCSGLVERVFRDQGIILPRTSYEQFRAGVGIPKAKLEPGDLVFFNTNGAGASHVGIYLGNGEFISATRNCVQKQSLDNPYWAGTYRGSRRVL
ncbi:MAG: Murein DD-endopeptidase MepS/Murein LD-carboxypeptidase [Candidatus Dichloromethanomonas elyunquensis]|nr:MAG: Murein DD-endopeptidase MepS/Murein LD-carboxypeptidase [Candidatus Dichloromethanomonas elyunquensis]